MANNLRESICIAVASLSTEKGGEDNDRLERQLKPLLEQARREGISDNDGISPLLVASDRGSVTCLQFLAEYDTEIVGSPLESCPPHGNTPVHHAAMSGCTAAWPIFQQMLFRTGRTDHCYISMGDATNSHGDTPLQIAVPAGHLEFIQGWYEHVEDSDAAKTILQSANQAGDTCASLACCHGHVAILDFLLNTCKIWISQAEVATCQKAVDRMDQALKTVTDPKALESFQGRQERVHLCFDRLKTTVTQRAEEAAKALLMQDETLSKSTRSNPNKKTKRKKKAKGKSSLTQNPTQQAAATLSEEDKKEDQFHVKLLNDGRVAVSVQGQTDESQPSLPLSTAPPLPIPSAEAMLRQRFRNSSDTDIDAVMDALCLDVAMLLYTPHGMALNLSPSQLDAVEQILVKQIGAVQQARNLQHNRLQAAEEAKTKGKENDD